MLVDLELQLRNHCRKLRVLERLSGGAHLLFPEGEYSLAIRTYDENDIKELNKKWPPTDSWKDWFSEEGYDSADGDDFDGLKAFKAAFKRTVLLFIIPFNKQLALINDAGSLFHRAQRTMLASTTRSVRLTARWLQ